MVKRCIQDEVGTLVEWLAADNRIILRYNYLKKGLTDTGFQEILVIEWAEAGESLEIMINSDSRWTYFYDV